jgi:hypothetical protein
MHVHDLTGRKETNTWVKVDAGGPVSVVNRGGGSAARQWPGRDGGGRRWACA